MREVLQPPVGTHATPQRLALGVFVAVLLVALNLRLAITSFGALVDLVIDAGLPLGISAFLTSLPVLCFAVVGAFGPSLSRRWGNHRALALALVLLSLGQLTRVTDGPAVLLIGTFVACAGIALANVLLPALVKEHFPGRVGLVTGAYSAVLSVGAALGAGLSVPLAEATGGWRGGLGWWALPAVLALASWLPFAHGRGAGPRSPSGGWLFREPLAWAVAVLFGLQSICAYAVMSWLPSVYTDAGFSHDTSGLLLAVSIVVGVPVFLVAPSLAASRPSQANLIGFFGLVGAAGFLGLWLAPAEGAWLWAVLLGVGGGAFPVSLALFALRTSRPEDTAALSGMGQCVGYSFAAAGPFLLGLLRDGTGSWALPCALLAAVSLAQVVVGRVAGAPRVLQGPGQRTGRLAGATSGTCGQGVGVDARPDGRKAR